MFMKPDRDIDITERRAPTDESIRIYDDLRERAISSILAAGRQGFEAKLLNWAVFEKPEFAGFEVRIDLSACDKVVDCSVRIDRRDVMNNPRPEAFCDAVSAKIQEAVANAVSGAITKQLFQEASRDIALQIEKTLRR